MKKYVIALCGILVAVICLSSCGTILSGETAAPELRGYEIVREMPDFSQDDLYMLVNSWFVQTFVSAESVIEYQDRDAGRVMGKYVIECDGSIYRYSVRQTIMVDVQEGRYRFTISEPYAKIISDIFGNNYDKDYAPLITVSGLEAVSPEWYKLEIEMEDYINTRDVDW